MKGTKCLVWIVGTCLVEIVSAQNEPHGCNYTHCIDTRISDFKSVISCGKVVSEDPVNGVKCAHVTLQRDRDAGSYTMLLLRCYIKDTAEWIIIMDNHYGQPNFYYTVCILYMYAYSIMLNILLVIPKRDIPLFRIFVSRCKCTIWIQTRRSKQEIWLLSTA